MLDPQVTIVVSPRERFSCARESLESIYEHTSVPFKLVYVDGGSPAHIQRYLQQQASEKGFQIIRTDHYLTPNRARNLGVSQVTTKYLVFIDNDVIVSPGWLESLVQCAEETNATVVGPLTCQGTPVHEIVHFAGGEAHIWLEKVGENPRRRLREKMYKQGQRVADVRPKLKRQQTELAEFHCVLVRTEIFEKVGLLDEQMFNTKEHLDFCMTVVEAGGSVYFEPACLVTYVPGPPLKPSDMLFYMLRWSDAWELNSLHRLRDKWNLDEDGYFKYRYKRLGWRRYVTILNPIGSRLTLGLAGGRFANLLVPLDKAFNRYLTDRQARLQAQGIKPQMPAVSEEKSTVTASSR